MWGKKNEYTRISNRIYHKVCNPAFLYFCLFGVFGILLDLDHIKKEWARQTHFAIFYIMWAGVIMYGAYICRLYMEDRGGMDELKGVRDKN